MSKTCDCAVNAPAASSDAAPGSDEENIRLDQLDVCHTAPRLWFLLGYQADPAMMKSNWHCAIGESMTELGND
jgi:hypothetical protein